MSDIFVSYTSSDSQWAQWIAADLRALGHTPHVHEWEIGPGADILNWMERHHAAADHVLCVVSEAYLKAPYSTLERNAAIWRAARERADFVLFVVVQPCALPALTEHFRRCEVFGLPEAAARQRFRAFMTARTAPAIVAFPGHAIAQSNITILVPHHFMGRDDAMAEIEATLARFQGRAAITALRGMRGVGKTVLAVAYAEKHRHDYRATWWIRAETADTIRADLTALGHRLGWTADGDSQDTALAKTADRLRREGEGILLIFDNALDRDSIAPFLPLGGTAHALITSNAHAWRGVAEAVEIRLWPREIGAAYLIARTGRPEEQAAAEALSDALEGLPLAHEMAAAYCEELGLPLATYGARFGAAPAEVLDDPDSAPVAYHDRLTVAKTFALAIEEAAKRHPAAEPLLVAAALLPAEPIPLFLFAEGRTKLADGLDGLLAGRGLERAVAALRRLALVDLETIPDERDPAVTIETIRLHRLIRTVAGWRRDGDAATECRRSLIAALRVVYPDGTYYNPDTWPRVRRLDPIAAGLLAEDVDLAPGAESDAALLLGGMAAYRHRALGAYQQARALEERALAIREETLGPEHPDTASSLHSLANTLISLGDQDRARALLERALAINEKVFGLDSPQTSDDLLTLGFVLRQQGDLERARTLHERALAIVEHVYGPDHEDTATALNTLAMVLHTQGDLAGARLLYERSLAIREKVYGAEHPTTAFSLHDLAACFQSQGDLVAAKPLFERALSIWENTLGADHPDTLLAVTSLAGLLDDQGDPIGAEKLHRRSLDGQIKAKGPAHPDVLRQQNNLGASLRHAGRADLAEPYARDCAENTPVVLGAAHPLTLHRHNNLALTLLMLRRAPEADALLAETWQMMAQHYAIVTPAVAFLALLSAGLQGHAPAGPIGRLKTLLLGPALPRAAGVAHTWDVGYLLEDLRKALLEDWHDFLSALLAAINDPTQAVSLDRFALWRDTPEVPLDVPWPDAGG